MSSFAPIFQLLVPGLLVVFRLGGLTIYGPVLGSSTIPIKVKILLTFLLGLAIAPVVGAKEPLELNLWMLAPLLLGELLIGLVIGFLASLPLMGAQTGGLLMGQQMGLGFVSFFNPAIDDEADVIGQVLFFMALAGFLLLGGHESLVEALLASFSTIPPGGIAADQGLVSMVSGMMVASLELALRVSAPLLALILLESVALGFVSKTVPQLNILSLGFPLRILIGLLVIAAGMAVIQDVLMDGVDHAMSVIHRWVGEGGVGNHG